MNIISVAFISSYIIELNNLEFQVYLMSASYQAIIPIVHNVNFACLCKGKEKMSYGGSRLRCSIEIEHDSTPRNRR